MRKFRKVLENNKMVIAIQPLHHIPREFREMKFDLLDYGIDLISEEHEVVRWEHLKKLIATIYLQRMTFNIKPDSSVKPLHLYIRTNGGQIQIRIWI